MRVERSDTWINETFNELTSWPGRSHSTPKVNEMPAAGNRLLGAGSHPSSLWLRRGDISMGNCDQLWWHEATLFITLETRDEMIVLWHCPFQIMPGEVQLICFHCFIHLFKKCFLMLQFGFPLSFVLPLVSSHTGVFIFSAVCSYLISWFLSVFNGLFFSPFFSPQPHVPECCIVSYRGELITCLGLLLWLLFFRLLCQFCFWTTVFQRAPVFRFDVLWIKDSSTPGLFAFLHLAILTPPRKPWTMKLRLFRHLPWPLGELKYAWAPPLSGQIIDFWVFFDFFGVFFFYFHISPLHHIEYMMHVFLMFSQFLLLWRVGL